MAVEIGVVLSKYTLKKSNQATKQERERERDIQRERKRERDIQRERETERERRKERETQRDYTNQALSYLVKQRK